MDEVKNPDLLRESIAVNGIGEAPRSYEEGLKWSLPSTNEIKNYAAWLRHEICEEVHSDINEYIFIMEGTCTMTFNGVKKDFAAGEFIFIPPHIKHKAVVTSAVPMGAIVQHRLI